MNSPYGLPVDCVDCHLRSDDFFCALSQPSLEALNQIKHAAVFPERAVIFVEGQTSRGIFMLCQGQAKLLTTARDGGTFILRIAKPGEVLGLHAVSTHGATVWWFGGPAWIRTKNQQIMSLLL
jgi:CRP/FNR family transcriptional regulator, cyclic AMP receptor protein